MSVKPPRPRGPHLNAMRSFEAAARLGGFAPAAEELGVTPGAVSQQVKALEDWIGAPLFHRRAHGVALTDLGARAIRDFTAAFDRLGAALHGLRAEASGIPVHIAALPSVAQLWLTPRLPRLRKAMPGQRIAVTALETPPNLRREVFDLALFFTEAAGAESHAILARDEIFPVCAPEVAAELRDLPDLASQTLIHDVSWSRDWPDWLRHAGWQGDMPKRRAEFSLYAIAVEEALGGGGVLMGHRPLVAQHLANGALVAPFDLALSTGRVLTAFSAHDAGTGGPGCQILGLLMDDS